MRINVYAEELTTETQIVKKVVSTPYCMNNGQEFYGIRLFLKSPQELHYKASDDDRSAITLWVPWTRKEGHSPQIVFDVLRQMIAQLVEEAINRNDKFLFREDRIFKGVTGHE